MRFDPLRVAGLPANAVPSGPKVPLPQRADRVEATDNSDVDRLAMLAIEDIEQYWTAHYRGELPGTFSPVTSLVSIDPTDPTGPSVCGLAASELQMNAMYCNDADVIAWDRAKLLPIARGYFGDMAVSGVLAHEYGHAVQSQAGLVDETPVLVREQQADCLAGAYLRWVAEGQSPRFTLNTTDALDRVIAGAIAMRDPVSISSILNDGTDGHGTALDRVSALQQGFDVGVHACAAIKMDEIEDRRGELPRALFDSATRSDMPISEDSLKSLFQDLGRVFQPTQQPSLSLAGKECHTTDAQPVVYCARTNTVVADIPALARIGAPADESQQVLLQGDDTAISMLMSRYALAIQHERGLKVDSAEAAMRTACLTGAAQSRMARDDGSTQFTLGSGDLDEAISGLLTSGLVASDVNGSVVPSGFTRITAFRAGLLDDIDGCFREFPS